MATIKYALIVLFLGIILVACEEPISHPIVGTWEGISDSSLGEINNVLKFEANGTYSWKQIYEGFKEIMEKRNPDYDWGDFGIETTGDFKVTTNNEVILSPGNASQLYGGEELEGGPMFPLFKEGYDYKHSYYFEDNYLVISGASGEDIFLERK